MLAEKEERMENLEKISSYGEMALEKLSDVLVFLDADSKKLYTDEHKFRTFFGVNPNRKWLESGSVLESDRVHPDDLTAINSKLSKFFEKEIFDTIDTIEFRALGASFDGEYFWVRCIVIPIGEAKKIKDNGCITGKYFLCFKNINKEKSKTLALLEAIRRDANTDLFNKKHTQESIERLLKVNKTGALFMVDIDDFKSINDRIGHLLGDTVILQVANSLKNMFHDGCVLGRVGGDEFVGYMPNVKKSEVITFANLILNTLSKIAYGVDGKYNVTVSVGVSRYPQDGLDYSMLYSCADLASYYSKLSGKNAYNLYDKTFMNWDKMKYIDERKATETMYETSFIKYIFQVFNETRDKETALELIMILVAQKFNASRCFYCAYCGKKVDYVFRWSVDGDLSKMDEIKSRFESSDYLKKYQSDGIYCRNDVNKANKDSVPYLKTAGIKSFLHCALLRDNVVVGFIAFESQDIYSEIDFAMLSVLGKMITEFIMHYEVEARLINENNLLKNVLDSLNKIIYVVESNNNNLVYINKACKKAHPMAEKGQKCFKSLRNKDTVCLDCPLRNIKVGEKIKLSYSIQDTAEAQTDFIVLSENTTNHVDVLCVSDILPLSELTKNKKN